MIQIVFSTIFLVAGIYAFIRGYLLAKKKAFYRNTWALNILGIYVWGDALVLGPFWAISGLLFYFMPSIGVIRYILLFYIFRSFVEIIYWINHQVAQRSYIPRLFSTLKWIEANDSAILYQLLHTIVVVVLVFIFISTFTV